MSAAGSRQPRESSSRDIVFLNTVVLWACRILIVLPQLVLIPYLIGRLGPSDYGVFTMIWTLLVGVDQLERSLQSGVIKYGAALLAKGDTPQLTKLLSSSQLFSVVLSLSAAAGIVCWALYWRSSGSAAATALFIVAAMPPLVMPLTPFVAVIQAGRRFYISALSETLGRYVSLGVIVLWFQAVSPSLNAVVVIMALTLLLSRVVQVPFARRMVPAVRVRATAFDGDSLRRIAGFGSVISLASLCLVFNSTGVRWMMGLMVSTAFVADLAIMLMPAILMEQLVSAVTITVMPAASAYDATQRRGHLADLLLTGSRYTLVLIASVVLACSVLIQDVLAVWIGPEYVRLGFPTMVLLIGQAALLVTSTAHHVLKGMGHLRVIVLAYSLGLVITPVLTIVPVLRLTGDPHMAVMVGLPAGALVAGLVQLNSVLGAVGLTWGRFARVALGRPLAVTSAVAAICWWASSAIPDELAWARLGVAITSVVMMAGGTYLLVARDEERQYVRTWLQGTFARIGPSSAR